MPSDADIIFRTVVLGIGPFGRRSLARVRDEKFRRPDELDAVTILDATRDTDRSIVAALDAAQALVAIADLSRPADANAVLHALSRRDWLTPAFVITPPPVPNILGDVGTTTTVIVQVPDTIPLRDAQHLSGSSALNRTRSVTATTGEVALAPIHAVHVFGVMGFDTEMLWELYPKGHTYVGHGFFGYTPQLVAGGLFARAAFKASGFLPRLESPAARVFMTFGLGCARTLTDVQGLLDESYGLSHEDADWVVAGAFVPWEAESIGVRLIVCSPRAEPSRGRGPDSCG
jgi:hypothetical protein